MVAPCIHLTQHMMRTSPQNMSFRIWARSLPEQACYRYECGFTSPGLNSSFESFRNATGAAVRHGLDQHDGIDSGSTRRLRTPRRKISWSAAAAAAAAATSSAIQCNRSIRVHNRQPSYLTCAPFDITFEGRAQRGGEQRSCCWVSLPGSRHRYQPSKEPCW